LDDEVTVMQVFKRHHNTLARVFVVGGLLAIVGLAVGGSAITRSPWWTKVGEPPDQPVPFSHKHHYEELGIDCRYCHWSVTESAHAGVPSTGSVHDLPLANLDEQPAAAARARQLQQ
jgi:hypothetical protein